MDAGAFVDDDASINAELELWRRIPPLQWVPDGNVPDGFRASSANFDDPDLSVVIADECTGGIATLLAGHPKFGVASFTVGEARALGWGVIRVPDVNLPGHAHVTGKKTGSKKSKLARTCRIIVTPTV